MERYLKKLECSYAKKFGKKNEIFPDSVKVAWDGRSVILTGSLPTVEERYKIGSFFAKHCKKTAHGIRHSSYKGLVNDILVNGKSEAPMKIPGITDKKLEGFSTDILIIGAGVIGCAIARELSRYDVSIAVIEKESDCAVHASSRNDGMIHPGFADNPKTIKGRLNTRGNRLYHKLGEELGFDTQWPGSFMLFNSPLLCLLLPLMHHRAKKNGVDGKVGYRSKKAVQKKDPHIQAKHYGGFWMPSAGIASPFKVTIAFAENAVQNGVRFFFETAAKGFDMRENKINAVFTNRGTVRAEIVINAAGLWSDKIAQFAGDRFFSIHPRKGMDMILDKKKGAFQHTIIGMPNLLASSKKNSKGGGLVPCIEGNILVGPTAREVYEREDYASDAEDTAGLNVHIALNDALSKTDVIAYYSGTRAANWEEDFIVEGSEKVANLVHAAAIQSPGFASAPAIAEDIAAITLKRLGEQRGKTVPWKNSFKAERKAETETAKLSAAEKNALIKRDSAYGKIVCRCEQVSEGEIRDAVKRCKILGLENISTDAVKRRCRAGMGRCHGGFCTPRVMEIIKAETGIPMEKITKKGGFSFILAGTTDGSK
ncbi:FAD-dependent oxidoreductase [Treponema sp. HNW]|uniref:NAD(P)/FAD-dependent oxidoreductase n=1 Tax=Treponema sp. HNW TaxID=3116654 RepID=UPI003D130A3F